MRDDVGFSWIFEVGPDDRWNESESDRLHECLANFAEADEGMEDGEVGRSGDAGDSLLSACFYD